MKKIKYISLGVALVTMVSCNGFLTEKPTTQLDKSTMYQTESALDASIYGCLRAFNDGSGPAGTIGYNLSLASGLLHWGYGTTLLTDAQERYTCMLKFTLYSNNVYSNSSYKSFYSAINRCNVLLSGMEDSSVDESYKRAIAGEAKLLRALAYYYLVRHYGDVPLKLTGSESLETINLPRTEFWKIYEQIVSDLKDAQDQMWDYDELGKYCGYASGRSCKWAATSLLSSVYLTIGTLLAHPDDNFWDTSTTKPDFSALGINSASDAFKLALSTAENVIQNGPYVLEPDFHTLFRWTDASDFMSKERILVITNTSESAAPFYMEQRTLPRFPAGTVDSIAANNSFGMMRPTRYVFQKWASTYGGEYRTDLPAAMSNICYNCADPRFDNTFIHTMYLNINTMSYEELYPAFSKVAYGVTSKIYEAYFKKYLDPKFNATSGYADFYIMRFAELYLIAAEAAANLSTSPNDDYWNKAFEYIEVIHARARASASDGEAEYPKWEADRFDEYAEPNEALINAIFWERVYELYGEGHEYYDTHRMGAKWMSENIAQPINEFLLEPAQQYEGRNMVSTERGYASKLYGSSDFQYPTSTEDLRKSLLVPFPYNELLYNSSISSSDQNPYYWK